MAEIIPAIKVTDPQSRDTNPMSPLNVQTQFGRSGTDNGGGSNALPNQGTKKRETRGLEFYQATEKEREKKKKRKRRKERKREGEENKETSGM